MITIWLLIVKRAWLIGQAGGVAIVALTRTAIFGNDRGGIAQG